MNLIIRYSIFIFLVLNSLYAAAQGGFFIKESVSEKIHFKLTNNLILIPLEINGIKLSFILDSGVSKPILFNLNEQDSLDLKNTKMFYLHGLGSDGKLKALKSSFNRIKLGNAVGVNQDLYVVLDSSINFTTRLGVVVNGIIGYDIFKDFVIEINYRSKYIRLHKPNRFKPSSSKKWKTLPINIHHKKPYLDAKVTIVKNEEPVKLLIDTGSSDAIWLFEDTDLGLTPDKNLVFVDYLGKGLSGSVYGKRSKVKGFSVSDFNLSDVNVAFPDSVSIDVAKVYKDRNGSIGGDILKRFHLFFDYTNNKLYLKKNKSFNESFTYNNSGIVLEHSGTQVVREEYKVTSQGVDNITDKTSKNTIQLDSYINYRMLIRPKFKVVELRKTSNAYISGLREGDVLIRLNGKLAYKYNLTEINKIFHGRTGKSISLTILRRRENMVFKFKLDNAFKKNEPSN